MPANRRTHNVYVIALDAAVLKDRRFREANPNYVQGKPCVYVGMTGIAPDLRFQQHKSGYKASRYPRRFGKYLRRKLFEHLNPMTYRQAVAKEKELARKLRDRGYGVWQN